MPQPHKAEGPHFVADEFAANERNVAMAMSVFLSILYSQPCCVALSLMELATKSDTTRLKKYNARTKSNERRPAWA